MLKDIVETRTVGGSGISIGTHLALETIFDVPIFDKDRKIPDRVNPNKYKTHVFNIYTLFRNVVGSIKHKNKEQLVSSKLVQEQLINDMYMLIELYNGLDTNLIFYLPNYSKLYKKFNNKKDKTIYTPYVTHTYIVENLKNLKFPGNVYINMFGGSLASTFGNTLLVSHFTLDLLNSEGMKNLSLLESHTGKIKTKREFGTKYHPIGKRDLSILPIHPRLLYILGDRTIVKPMPITDRKAVYELAIKEHLNPESSKFKTGNLVRGYLKEIPV